MYAPAPLQKGDTIAITCPSGYLDFEKIQNSIEAFTSWGLEVVVGDTLKYASDNYFSAPDEIKISELQHFLDDSNVKAIFMGRGGYGMSRIIDALDFDAFILSPKWICGFSDITLLHLHINAKGISSLHAPMCSTFNLVDEKIKEDNILYLKNGLFGQCLLSYNYTSKSNHFINGSSEGVLLGGNLAMLSHAVGSKSMPDFRDGILFIEDIGEHIYKIDRMLYQLKRAGVFEGIVGVIVGQFTDIEDTTRPFGASWEEVIMAHFVNLGIPVAFDFPSGHEDRNLTLKLGSRYKLDINYHDVKLVECTIIS